MGGKLNLELLEESRKLLGQWKTTIGGSETLERDFHTHLYDLLENFLNRPQKAFRRQFVQIGAALVRSEPFNAAQIKALDYCGHAIEALHSGSLIVDDIQDQSSVRRGQPTLHLEFGLPKALNAGNWLYFYASHLVRASKLSPDIRLALYEAMEETLLEAHAGQAMDLGAEVHHEQDPHRIVEICRASMSLKSGSLFRLAIEMGARVAEASPQQIQAIRSLGFRTGLCLQMFDDLGNLDLSQPTAKHLEDLALRRPSFVWWTLAESFPSHLAEFNLRLNQLPNVTPLRDFLSRVPVRLEGIQKAHQFKNQILSDLLNVSDLQAGGKKEFQNVIERISNAYFLTQQ